MVVHRKPYITLFMQAISCFEPTQTQGKQTLIIHFPIVAKDDFFWLSIVTSHNCEAQTLWHHRPQSFLYSQNGAKLILTSKYGLAQDCSNSIANAMELLQSCTKRLIYSEKWSICHLINRHLSSLPILLTHWGQVTHICIGRLTTIGSDNGLVPSRHQAIIWTNAGILLIGPLRTYFS